MKPRRTKSASWWISSQHRCLHPPGQSQGHVSAKERGRDSKVSEILTKLPSSSVIANTNPQQDNLNMIFLITFI